MEVAAFYIFGAGLLGLSLLVILSHHPAYAVLYLLGAMFCLSALYVLLGAFFVATLQIVLYAGAVLVMFLFVIMLLSLDQDLEAKGSTPLKILGVAVGVMLLVAMISILVRSLTDLRPFRLDAMVGNVVQLGELLFTTYLFPFEITSLLILAAIIGAVVISKRNWLSEGTSE